MAGSCRGGPPPGPSADRERELAEPLTRLRPHGHRPDEHAPLGVRGELDEARPSGALVCGETAAGDLVTGGHDAVALHRADRGHLRIGEHRRGDRPVVGAQILSCDVRGGDAGLVLAEVREETDPGCVTDRPDAVGCAKSIVDGYASLRDLDAKLFQPEVMHARPPARSDEQSLSVEGLP